MWYLVAFFCSFMPVFQAMFCAILYILHSLCNLEPACTYWFHLYIFIPFCFLHAVFLVCFFCTTFSCFHPLSSILQILVSVPPFHMHDLLDLVWGSSVKCGFYLVLLSASVIMLPSINSHTSPELEPDSDGCFPSPVPLYKVNFRSHWKNYNTRMLVPLSYLLHRYFFSFEVKYPEPQKREKPPLTGIFCEHVVQVLS